MDLNFEQMLAQHNQEFKEAEVFDNWMPPDGDYIVSLVKLSHGSSTKDGKDLVWWRLTGRIEDVQDEKLNGKEFSVGYYTSKAFGILKGAVKTLAGDLINDLGEAHAILEASLGQIIRAKVETRPGKGANVGKDFTNCYIQEVIETTASAGQETQVDTQADVGLLDPAAVADVDPGAVEQQAPAEVAEVVGGEIPLVETPTAEAPPVV